LLRGEEGVASETRAEKVKVHLSKKEGKGERIEEKGRGGRISLLYKPLAALERKTTKTSVCVAKT